MGCHVARAPIFGLICQLSYVLNGLIGDTSKAKVSSLLGYTSTGQYNKESLSPEQSSYTYLPSLDNDKREGESFER